MSLASVGTTVAEHCLWLEQLRDEIWRKVEGDVIATANIDERFYEAYEKMRDITPDEFETIKKIATHFIVEPRYWFGGMLIVGVTFHSIPVEAGAKPKAIIAIDRDLLSFEDRFNSEFDELSKLVLAESNQQLLVQYEMVN